MKVILVEDINNLGQAGEIVDVKRGYANNFLLRKGLAIRANKVNLNQLKTQQKAFEAKRAKSLALAQEKAEKIKGEEFTIKVKTGEAGRLFGSITTIDLSEVLEENGYTVGRRDLSILDNIKEIGTYTANVRLHPDIDVDIVIHVEDEDAEKQKELVAAKEAEEARRAAQQKTAAELAEEKEVDQQIDQAIAAAESQEADTEEADTEEADSEEE